MLLLLLLTKNGNYCNILRQNKHIDIFPNKLCYLRQTVFNSKLKIRSIKYEICIPVLEFVYRQQRIQLNQYKKLVFVEESFS